MMDILMLFVSAFCGYCAYDCFRNGNDFWGWANLVMSAWNFANFLNKIA